LTVEAVTVTEDPAVTVCGRMALIAGVALAHWATRSKLPVKV